MEDLPFYYRAGLGCRDEKAGITASARSRLTAGLQPGRLSRFRQCTAERPDQEGDFRPATGKPRPPVLPSIAPYEALIQID